MATTDEYKILPLSSVITSDFANTRTGDITKQVAKDGDNGDQGFEEFRKSLAKEGQLSPVIVRPSAKRKGKYDLIAGFRRHAALEANAKEEGTKSPTIVAIVKPHLSDYQARTINLFENTSRDQLKGPELAFGIQDLFVQAEQEGRQPTQQEIAKSLGITQPYVHKLANIMQKLKPEIALRWRDAEVPISVNAITAVSKKPHAEQEAAFKEAYSAKQGDSAPKGGVAGALRKATDKLQQLGLVIAQLDTRMDEHVDGVNYTHTTIEILEELGFLKLPEGATSADRKKLAIAMTDGYNSKPTPAAATEPTVPAVKRRVKKKTSGKAA